MRTHARRGGIPLLAVALLTAAPGSAEDDHAPLRIPGTHVSLRVPEGFAVSAELPGLGRDADLSSVLVTELTTPFEVAARSFDAEALARRGLTLHRSARVEVAGRAGLLLHASQRAGGVDFRKWLLLFGDDRASVLLTATTPLDLEALHQEALVETLRSARWDPELPDAPRPGLRFRVQAFPPLRVVRSGASALVLTDPEHDAARSVAPLVVVGSSTGRVRIADLAGFSRERLQQTVSIEQIEVESESARTLGGLPGTQIHARAHDVQSGRPVRVTQVLADDGERYYLVQGIFDAEDQDAYAAVLERVIGSFSLAR